MSEATTQVATKQATPSITPQQSEQQPTPKRPMSTVERDLPPWLKAAMNGKSRNGYLSGRGGQTR